jgi:hypothetical protein
LKINKATKSEIANYLDLQFVTEQNVKQYKALSKVFAEKLYYSNKKPNRQPPF